MRRNRYKSTSFGPTESEKREVYAEMAKDLRKIQRDNLKFEAQVILTMLGMVGLIAFTLWVIF